MKPPIVIRHLCTALLLLIAATAVQAEWALDGNPVSSPVQLDQWDYVLIPGFDGSVIVVYVAHETGYHDIWATRFNAWGNPMWDAVPVAVESNEQYAPVAVSDGMGGVIVAWTDFRSGTSEAVYAQRVDFNGVPVWAPNGIPLNGGTGTSPRICSDHAGGAVVAWRDSRGADADIYAQRLNPDGSELWTAGGFGVCTAVGDQGEFVMADDGLGGAYFAWSALGTTGLDNDILGQHAVAGGWIDWHLDPGGREICGWPGDQWSPVAAADGHGRFLVGWFDLRSTTSYDVYAQMVDVNGNGVWTSDGAAVMTGGGGRWDLDVESDGVGGAILAWYDGSLWSQRLDIDGVGMWGSAGLMVCDARGSQNMPRIVPLGDGGAVVAWEDDRFGNYDIYSQRLNAAGFVEWPVDGVALVSDPTDQRIPYLIGDGEGGGFAAWLDSRVQYENTIYIQRVDRFGNWGYPSPNIVDVADIPGDQGWQVSVSWQASRLDPWPAQAIESYSLWRALDPPPEKALPGDAVFVDLADFVPGQKGRFIRKDENPDKSFYWEYLGEAWARNLTQYGQALPTLFNLTPESQGYHHFQVVAHGPTPIGMGYWISQPDTGRSIDNLAPDAPAMVTGAQVYDPTRLEITWDPNAEADLSNYEVYRGTAPGFIPSATNLVGSPVEPVLALGGLQAGYYYKVSARDVHGNESEYALLAPAEVSATGSVPEATSLSGVHPNPFNPKATIAFTVRDPQRVTVSVFDVTGRRVAVLTDEVWPTGSHDLTWNGRDTTGREMSSGVYFVNFRAGATAVTEKVMLVR